MSILVRLPHNMALLMWPAENPRNGKTFYVLKNRHGHQARLNSRGWNVTTSYIGNKLPTWCEVFGQRIPLNINGNQATATQIPIMVDGKQQLFGLAITRTLNGYNLRGQLGGPGSRS